MSKSPSFQFYPKQWLGDDNVILMDWDARAMHMHCMCIAWQQHPPCTLPDDDVLLQKWCGNPKDWKRLKGQIFRAWRLRRGRWVQEGLLKEYDKQRKFSESRQHAARVRWDKSADAYALHMECSSSSSSSSDLKKDKDMCESVVKSRKTAAAYMPDLEEEVACITFPYRRGGHVVNVKYRGLAQKVFRQVAHAEKIVFNLDALAEQTEGIIVEGELDALSIMQAGLMHVVSVPDGAPPPANSKPTDQKFDYLNTCADELSRLTKIVLAVDDDEPGKTLEAELARRLGPERCWRVRFPENCKDANDVLLHYGSDRLRDMIDHATAYPLEGVLTVADVAEDVIRLLDWIDKHFLFIVPEDAITIFHLMQTAKSLVARHGIRGLIIDPWNEFEHTRPSGQTETEYISTCLGQVRRFARNHGVAVWLVAHPQKLYRRDDGTYPVPTPYDISGSAHWRNKADNCLTVWRDEQAPQEPIILYVQKIRFREVGSVGQVPLAWNRVNGRYVEPTYSTTAHWQDRDR